MKKLNKKKIFMIGGISILALTLLTGTYALYRLLLFDDLTLSTHTNELDYYITYEKGTDIDVSDIELVSNYDEMEGTTITFYKNDDTYDIYGHFYLKIYEIGENLSKCKALKYTIVDDNNDEVLTEGLVSDLIGFINPPPVYTNLPLETNNNTYTVYIWLDENTYDYSNNISYETLSISIYLEASMKEKEINYSYLGNGVEYISNLYETASKTPIEHTGANITYNYANIYGDNGGLMNDRLGSMSTNIDDGNIRYYGKNPNNYIYFNCTDYSNQNDSTCEKWRIIGVFDTDDGAGNIEKRLKIIRNYSIGNYSWDTSASGINNGYGINQWGSSEDYAGADLMKLLNPGYEDNKKDGTDTLANNSLYYNRQSGTCFSGNSNATTGCNFTTSGITNTTKGLISDAVWYLGGFSSSSIYANEAYAKERGNNVVVPGTTCSGTFCNDTVTRTTTWTGKVGLMYLSDYGYAADLNKCTTLGSYSSSTNNYECRSNDWLYNGNAQWTIVPYASGANSAWCASSDGSFYIYNARYSNAVRPVYYLNSKLLFAKGDGTINNPYRVM